MCPIVFNGAPQYSQMEPRFAGMTFFAMSQAHDMCGSNGLPLPPNSITIYGRSQFLRTLQHPHLCTYLDIIRGKHERTVIVSEYYPRSVASVLSERPFSVCEIIHVCKQSLEALAYLNTKAIVHRNLAPNNILINSEGNVQLFNYGLYYMTGQGADVSFPIGQPRYMAPEVLLHYGENVSGPKVDVWSLGLILAELSLGISLWSGLKLGPLMRKVLSLLNCNSNATVFARLAREHNCWEPYQKLPQPLVDIISACLSVTPSKRPTAAELLKHPALQELLKEDAAVLLASEQRKEQSHPLNSRALSELYYLWQLAGGDVQVELKRQGLIRTTPPILSLPSLVLLEGSVLGQRRDQTSLLDLRVVPLQLDNLVQRLAHLPIDAYYPLIETCSNIINKEEKYDSAALPLIIRERNTEYQFRRIVHYHRLLESYPYKKAAIIREARKDIPPLLRADIWTSLLEVDGDVTGRYMRVDKETPTHTDRQIEVDIPRCHQYDELLSSREGHHKFKRVLKAWVQSNPQYVYWQGLDSLCAPFIYLNFNNEARAFACISAFIPKYLYRFFLKDNSAVIREYLAKFSHLIAFHDPALANHLQEITFIPDLFAIPWFLTMFSHVFPLHKIFHLWDQLLLGDASFPLFVGLAILQQLRDTLLSSGFNECILLFSDLPEIDIERCLVDSIEFYCITPRSTTYRQHELRKSSSSKSLPELEMCALTVPELQAEMCPRISAADVLELLDPNKFPRPKAQVLDVRSPDLMMNIGTSEQIEKTQIKTLRPLPGPLLTLSVSLHVDHPVQSANSSFAQGTISGSINLPYQRIDWTVDEPQLPNCPETNQLLQHRGKVIVVAGQADNQHAADVARVLVRQGFARVSSLHGGVEVLKHADALVVPAIS